MKIYKLAKHYSINRDDNELRVVICPKCRKSDITKTDEPIALSYNNHPLKLCKCNSCKTYFTFYREDGMREISKEEAKGGVSRGLLDVQEKGKNKGRDNHGHSYYIAFKEKPKTIPSDDYDALFDDNTTWEQNDRWKKNNLIDLNSIIQHWDIISRIDY